ncbi:MAG: DUF3576 domain-containing protein [Magnetococcales bacterium]|nr:DUF3576 domain-containing protein [Magnetococcales bacterium]MBF0437784.1 DUF3576 domain-containing protein [Magnetococcales bacterium]
MKANFLTVAVTILTLGIGGCSGNLWNSPNTLEDQKFAKFGQKKAREDALEGRDNSSAELLGQESIFGFGGGSGTKQTQEQIRLEKLFAGTLDVVMELPIQVSNREGGFVSTDWKTDPNDATSRYRLNIRLSGQAPYGDVKVVVLKQSQQRDGNWTDAPSDAETARQIEKAIRKKAQIARP